MKSRIASIFVSQPLLLGIGFAALVAVAAAGVTLSVQGEGDAGRIEHTLIVEKQIANLLLEFRRAESAQRGYMLTRDSAYLGDYRRARDGVAPARDQLRQFTADNQHQQRLLDEMKPIIDERLSGFDKSIELIQNGDTTAAMAIVGSGVARTHMEAVRGLAERMAAEEEKLLRERRAASQRTSALLLGVSLGGAALIGLLAVASVWLVRRSNRKRDEAERALIESNENLEEIVNERTADLIEANEEIQRFAYIVSHDLRTPLVNIMGFTTELETWRAQMFDELSKLRKGQPVGAASGDADLGAEFDEAISFIKMSISKMDLLINAVLKLSREGRRNFHPEPIDMAELLAAVTSSLGHQVSEADATLTLGQLPALTSDRMAIEQIFSNLVDNALKYLRGDTPGRVEVSGYETRNHVVYEVKDNGRGIDSRDHQRVFELFRRAGALDRPGEGIGLAHVRALVRRLGGKLDLNSALGEGSVFTVTLPKNWLAHDERTAA